MFPWQIKSIFVIAFALRFGVVILSITHFVPEVDSRFHMRIQLDLLQQRQLGPAESLNGLNIPGPFLER